jgi:hypothetical protein
MFAMVLALLCTLAFYPSLSSIELPFQHYNLLTSMLPLPH